MLSIRKISIRNANYYVELAREDYYLSGGEPPGQWHGQGGHTLGLTAEVTREQFENLFQGFSPDGKTALVQNAGQKTGYHRRVPGWDLTFSAPKSVSVCWALAPEEMRQAIGEAHEKAVRTALDLMEEFDGVTRRGSGGRIREKAGFCCALFEHGTSRAQDPQLHTHAICFNLAFRKDGTTGSVRSKDLFLYKMAVGSLYRSELAALLQRQLRLPIEQVGSGFAVKGLNPELEKAFSTRRLQILAHCEKAGVYNAVQAEKSALATREVKGHTAREALFRVWQEKARAMGWGQAEVASLRMVPALPSHTSVEKERLTESVGAAATAFQGKLTPGKVLEVVAGEAQGLGLTARELVAAVHQTDPKRAQHGRSKEEAKVQLDAESVRDGRPEKLEKAQAGAASKISELENRLRKALEAAHQKAADKLNNRAGRPGSPGTTNQGDANKSDHGLGGDGAQAEASGNDREGKSETERPHAAEGGSGARESRKNQRWLPKRKPFVVIKVKDQKPKLGRPRWVIHLRFFSLEVRDRRVFPKAPAWSPLSQLALSSLVISPHQDPFGMKRRLILLLDSVRDRARRQIKEAMKAVFAMGVRKILFIDERLNPRSRERDTWAGKPRGKARSRVVMAKTGSQLWRQLLKDWAPKGVAEPRNHLILAQTKARVDGLNRMIQEARRRKGRIGGKSVKRGLISIHENDRVIFHTGHRSLEIEPGDVGTISKLCRAEMSVILDNGKQVLVPHKVPISYSLAYALKHVDAQKVKTDRAYILFEANDPAREMASVVRQQAKSRVRSYALAEHAPFFTAEGCARMRDDFREEEKEQQERTEQWREAREAEKRRREEERIRREEETRRNQTQSNHQSQSHSH